MGNKKRYLLEHDGTYFDMTIEIDHDLVTDKELTEINEFWTRSEERLDAAGGDVLKAVLRMLCQCVIHLQFEYGYNAQGIRDLFDWDKRHNGQEGWPKMDGSDGFHIVNVSETEIPASEITVKEVPVP